MLRRDSDCVGQRMLEMELPEKRKRERAQRRFVDVVKPSRGQGEMEADDPLW